LLPPAQPSIVLKIESASWRTKSEESAKVSARRHKQRCPFTRSPATNLATTRTATIRSKEQTFATTLNDENDDDDDDDDETDDEDADDEEVKEEEEEVDGNNERSVFAVSTIDNLLPATAEEEVRMGMFSSAMLLAWEEFGCTSRRKAQTSSSCPEIVGPIDPQTTSAAARSGEGFWGSRAQERRRGDQSRARDGEQEQYEPTTPSAAARTVIGACTETIGEIKIRIGVSKYYSYLGINSKILDELSIAGEKAFTAADGGLQNANNLGVSLLLPYQITKIKAPALLGARASFAPIGVFDVIDHGVLASIWGIIRRCCIVAA
jgi:hypothetical protein